MMREVEDLLRNIFYDTAASPLLYNDKIFDVSLEIVGANKILFGSDYPLMKQKNIFKTLNSSRFNATEKSLIHGELAASVFKITTR